MPLLFGSTLTLVTSLFFFFTFFKNFRTVCLGVRFRLALRLPLRLVLALGLTLQLAFVLLGMAFVLLGLVLG